MPRNLTQHLPWHDEYRTLEPDEDLTAMSTITYEIPDSSLAIPTAHYRVSFRLEHIPAYGMRTQIGGRLLSVNNAKVLPGGEVTIIAHIVRLDGGEVTGAGVSHIQKLVRSGSRDPIAYSADRTEVTLHISCADDDQVTLDSSGFQIRRTTVGVGFWGYGPQDDVPEPDTEPLWLPEPIVAYRLWSWELGELHGYRVEWPPPGELTSTCRDAELLHPEDLRTPNWSCGCGIYGLKEHPIGYQPGRSNIVGRVEMFGRVIEHAEGYRSEHARIIWINRRLLPDDVRKKLKKAYNLDDEGNVLRDKDRKTEKDH